MASLEEDPIPLSALQHWAYCPRQCGLIHLDQAFDENVHTLRGQAVHKRVDQPGVETAKGVRVEHALPLWHDHLGLIGKADVVEFDKARRPYPVEYKQGSRHKAANIAACDDLQLAAQAMCLETMFGVDVPEGAIYYASSKRRRVVVIDPALREQVLHVVDAVRGMFRTQKLPPPLEGSSAVQRCRACSLHDRCQPEAWQGVAMRQARQALFNPEADMGG
ncbi:CRISPR-associated protein Cas4 [Aquabacterium sp. A08]|uniref:CRISPR-associated protein Cas4 n=1 Tax=Aquabacterium sp. A08 TaxID=2718532 RepID=UPI00142217AE|nr:CRISPR-associated protein Cas4 [Aquabacterium sp. A08]NIC40821.1 CRISPR-associated protein Cas4 [Aquabacterium sp. A08]